MKGICMKRKSGVLLHPSSLWGDYSIGSFGKEAREFVDFLCECGFGVWQTLPFCIPDEFNSPYKSPAAFSLNPFFIDLPELHRDGLITDAELLLAEGTEKYLCEFERLKRERMPLLFKAAKRALKNGRIKAEVKAFILKNPRIEKACKFLASKEKGDFERGFLSWEFLHYEFYRQWWNLKKYANEKGVEIIGDIPIYVSFDSADVWEYPENFLLDRDGFPSEVAGVPPDYFSPRGQLWGNPIYDYSKMSKNGFSWWKERTEHALSLFDGARIDHFRGFSEYWSIPKNSETAASGAWRRGPGKELIAAISEVAQKRLLIAEDLGDIDERTAELRDAFSLPGMRVFQFAFLGDRSSEHLPHNFIKNCVAYSGTHDNNTLLGYLFECDSATREKIFEYCGYTGENIDEGLKYVIRALFASSANLVIFPIQDILGFGADTRMNTPGRGEGNWAYRVVREQIFSVDRAYYKRLNALYSRD